MGGQVSIALQGMSSHLSIWPGRRGHDDCLAAGDLCGHSHHEGGRGQHGCAPGDVNADSACERERKTQDSGGQTCPQHVLPRPPLLDLPLPWGSPMGLVTLRQTTPGMVSTVRSFGIWASWKALMLLYATSKASVTSLGSTGAGKSCVHGNGGDVRSPPVCAHAASGPMHACTRGAAAPRS